MGSGTVASTRVTPGAAATIWPGTVNVEPDGMADVALAGSAAATAAPTGSEEAAAVTTGPLMLFLRVPGIGLVLFDLPFFVVGFGLGGLLAPGSGSTLTSGR
jgi:hypothetical protein